MSDLNQAIFNIINFPEDIPNALIDDLATVMEAARLVANPLPQTELIEDFVTELLQGDLINQNSSNIEGEVRQVVLNLTGRWDAALTGRYRMTELEVAAVHEIKGDTGMNDLPDLMDLSDRTRLNREKRELIVEAWLAGRLVESDRVIVVPSCPTCNGSGEYADVFNEEGDFDVVKCAPCNGSGYHPDTIEQLAEVLWRQFIALWDDLTAEHTRWDENPEIHDRWRVRAVAVLGSLTGDTG